MSSGEPIAAPALLAFESAVIAEPLLRALAEQPLAADEGYSLGDGLRDVRVRGSTGHRVRAGRDSDRGGDCRGRPRAGPQISRASCIAKIGRVEAVIWSDRGDAVEGAAGASGRLRAIVSRLADSGLSVRVRLSSRRR